MMTYAVAQVDQHAVPLLHIMRLEPGNQRPYEQPELASVERA